MIKSYKSEFLGFIASLQEDICSTLEKEDGAAQFLIDEWNREGGGGGSTRILEGGAIFEKAGVNTSAVFGELPASLQKQLKVDQSRFFACGLSLVIHPNNPFIPTVHANYRYFELYDEQEQIVDQWFGGGSDLTPYYLFEEDVLHFHNHLKEACDNHHAGLYEKYKKACDEYFYNAHRNEARGVGGLFFDYLRPTEKFDETFWFQFVVDMGQSFLPSYMPIVARRRLHTFDTQHKQWQEIRRGRYVEFNLIHDKGTLFGLRSKGRIESILMSLPSTVRWTYNHHPEEGSEEEKLIRVLKEPREWA